MYFHSKVIIYISVLMATDYYREKISVGSKQRIWTHQAEKFYIVLPYSTLYVGASVNLRDCD